MPSVWWARALRRLCGATLCRVGVHPWSWTNLEGDRWCPCCQRVVDPPWLLELWRAASAYARYRKAVRSFY